MEAARKLRARFELMQWTGMRGLPNGMARAGRLQARRRRVSRRGRPGKGGETAPGLLPQEGVAALRDFVAIAAPGEWKTAPANREFAKAATRAGRPALIIHQIRHSFATGLRQSGTDIADALLRFHRLPLGAQREMGLRACAHAERMFDSGRFAGEYTRLIDSVGARVRRSRWRRCYQIIGMYSE